MSERSLHRRRAPAAHTGSAACQVALNQRTTTRLAAMLISSAPRKAALNQRTATRLAATTLSAVLLGATTSNAAPSPAAVLFAAVPDGATTTAGAAATPPPDATAPGAAMPTEDIRDIRGPKFILPAWLIPAVVAGAALLAFLAYRLWRWRQRRRAPRALLPFEAALQRLEDIRPLMQPSSAREFSIAVSDIVRGYIEQRFDVTATHRTTEEFLHDLLQTTKPSLARHRGLLGGFLQQCDLVKFGGMSLSPQSMESLHHSAREFVLETAKPDPVEPKDKDKNKEAHDPLPTT